MKGIDDKIEKCFMSFMSHALAFGLPSWRAARTLQFLKLILSCGLLVLGLYQQLVGYLLLGLACLPLFYRLVLLQAFGYPAFACTTWKCKISATHARLSWNCHGKQDRKHAREQPAESLPQSCDVQKIPLLRCQNLTSSRLKWLYNFHGSRGADITWGFRNQAAMS